MIWKVTVSLVCSLLALATVLENGVAQQTCSSSPKGVLVEGVYGGIADGSVVLIDVRTKEELFRDGKIPGSHNIPLDQLSVLSLLPAQFLQVAGFPKPEPERVVFSCQSGVRATRAWQAASAVGYCRARVFFGSFLEWTARQLPVEKVA